MRDVIFPFITIICIDTCVLNFESVLYIDNEKNIMKYCFNIYLEMVTLNYVQNLYRNINTGHD